MAINLSDVVFEYKVGQKIQRNEKKGDCSCQGGDIFIITEVKEDCVYFSKNGKNLDGIECKDWCRHYPQIIQENFNLILEGSASSSNEPQTEPKKIFMESIKEFAKNLILSKSEKKFRKHNLKDNCGEYTQEYKDIVLAKIYQENEDYVLGIVEKQEKEEEEEKKK